MPSEAAAALHALLHHLPDAQQARADLRLGAPGLLVLHHDGADGQALALTVREQLGGGAEREALRRLVRAHGGLARRGGLVHHEASAHRVVDAHAQLRAGAVPRGEAHAVGVERQRAAAVQHELLGLAEGHLALAQHRDAALGLPAEDARGDALHVHALGRLAHAGPGARPCRCRGPCPWRPASRTARPSGAPAARACPPRAAAARTSAPRAWAPRCASWRDRFQS